MSDYCFVITGCTAGLGLALLERLISEYPSSHFIAICRNKSKTERVFKDLIEKLKKTDGRFDGKSIPRKIDSAKIFRKIKYRKPGFLESFPV